MVEREREREREGEREGGRGEGGREGETSACILISCNLENIMYQLARQSQIFDSTVALHA